MKVILIALTLALFACNETEIKQECFSETTLDNAVFKMSTVAHSNGYVMGLREATIQLIASGKIDIDQATKHYKTDSLEFLIIIKDYYHPQPTP